MKAARLGAKRQALSRLDGVIVAFYRRLLARDVERVLEEYRARGRRLAPLSGNEAAPARVCKAAGLARYHALALAAGGYALCRPIQEMATIYRELRRRGLTGDQAILITQAAAVSADSLTAIAVKHTKLVAQVGDGQGEVAALLITAEALGAAPHHDVVALYRAFGGRLDGPLGRQSVKAALLALTTLVSGARRQQVMAISGAFDDAGVPASDVPHLVASIIGTGARRACLWAVLTAHRIVMEQRAEEISRRPTVRMAG